MEEAESTSCEQLQEKYKELKGALDTCQRMLSREGFTSEEYREITRTVAEKKQVLEKLIEKEYFKHFSTIEQAQEIMKGEQFIGPEDIKETFGFSPDVPEIPFSAEELRHAQALNQKLILYVDKKDNEPFTIEVMQTILDNKTSTGDQLVFNAHPPEEEETPRLGWRLTTPAAIANSKGRDYMEQTEVLIEYLKNTVFKFKGKTLPKLYQEAITEFEKEKDDIVDLIKASDWGLAGSKLAQLAINQHTRENAAEVIYRLAITERQHKKRELEKEYTWTNSVATDGKLMSVGDFGSDGINTISWWFDENGGDWGVCFSRSV